MGYRDLLLLFAFAVSALSAQEPQWQLIGSGSISPGQNSGLVSTQLSREDEVQYEINLSSTYVFGASVRIDLVNSTNTVLATTSTHTGSWYSNTVVKVPVGIGHMDWYKSTLHEIARPVGVVIYSLNNQVTYTIAECQVERPGYNDAGKTPQEARLITSRDVLRGNVHPLEGGGWGLPSGGQFYKIELANGETIKPHGRGLGHHYYGASLSIALFDANLTFIKTLATIAVYDVTYFPTPQKPSYEYTHTGEPETYYIQIYSSMNIVHDFAVYLEPMAIELDLGPYTINSSNDYSEDFTVYVTAVHPGTGQVLPFWTGTVELEEAGTEIYKRHGFLPRYVDVVNGHGMFVAQSLADPSDSGVSGEPPRPAKIRPTNYLLKDDSTLAIPQWVVPGNSIDPKAEGPVPAWMQTKIKEIFQNATGQLAEVLSHVESYEVKALSGKGGETYWKRSPASPIAINPYSSRMRRTETAVGKCGYIDGVNQMRNTLLHEGHHTYHASRTVAPGNDGDFDFLLTTPNPIGPFGGSIVDSNEPRWVCDQDTPAGTVYYDHRYKGDSQFDTDKDPDWASYAWEMTAWAFAMTY